MGAQALDRNSYASMGVSRSHTEKNPSKCHGVSKTPVLRPFRGVTFGWSGVSIGGVGILRVSNFLGYQLRYF